MNRGKSVALSGKDHSVNLLNENEKLRSGSVDRLAHAVRYAENLAKSFGPGRKRGRGLVPLGGVGVRAPDVGA